MTPAQQRNNALRSSGLPLLRLLVELAGEGDHERRERIWCAIGVGSWRLRQEIGPADADVVEADLARLEGRAPPRRTRLLRSEYL